MAWQSQWHNLAVGTPRNDVHPARETGLLVDGPAGGVWNMAVDELLLAQAAQGDGVALRFYEWSEPTLSLGYFQKYADRHAHPGSRDCAVVRRASGGGAILHDRELTYALVLPAGHRLSGRAELLYLAVHEALVDSLATAGVEAQVRPPCSDPASEGGPLLCFQRRAAGDVLVGDVKIGGSAQRRHRGAVLQHGSVLLRGSAAAPELLGIEELAGVKLAAAELIALWCPAIQDRLGLSLRVRVLSAGEVALAEKLAHTKFGQTAWTQRR